MMSKISRNVVTVSGMSLAFALTTPAFAGPKPAAKAAVPAVTGRYIEARSASVYAGACHYNGEVTTAGREAILAWKVARGTWNGQKLDGLVAVALVSGSDNLAFGTSTRRSSLLVDAHATKAQQAALAAWVQTKAGKALGTVAQVTPAMVAFKNDALNTTVQAGQLVNIAAKSYPCSHCLMPAQTWYRPLTPLTDVQVAQGLQTSFSDATLQVSWSQTDADNCFVGTF